MTPNTTDKTDRAPTWLIVTAKAGYASRGLLYLLIGLFALLKALGNGGESTDSKGALHAMLRMPFGQALVMLVGIGLIGYSVWRFCQAVFDTDDHGLNHKGAAIRAGLLISCFTHLSLAGYSVYIAIAYVRSDDGSSSEAFVARLLELPGGRWIVLAIGVAWGGAGIAHAIKSFKEGYQEHFKIKSKLMSLLDPICKFGLYARFFVFIVISGMFIAAALTHQSGEAGGLNQVIDLIAEQIYGRVLLAVLAAGLMSFGLYSIIESVFRRIDHPLG